MNRTDLPLVTIGLPVYNGERFLGRAIESILAQSFADFDLIILDNNSEDGTQEICMTYLLQDDRVHYQRNERNIGAAQNFNKALDGASSRYFKWGAHDDWIAPMFLACCVEGLERHPDAIGCWTGAVFVDENEVELAQQPLRGEPDRLNVTSPVRRRFHEALRIHPGPVLFGLFRTDQLKRTGMMRGTVGSDRVLLAELSLLGGFHWNPDRLLYYTHYPKSRVGYYTDDWWDPASSPQHSLRAVQVQASQCAALVTAAGLSPADTAALLGSIATKYGPLAFKRTLAAACRTAVSSSDDRENRR